MNSDICKQFATKLQEIRKARKLTQEQLAERIDIGTPNISYFETGKFSPSIETLEKIADYFHVSVDYLLGRSDSRTYDNLVFDTDLDHLKKAFDNAPAL